MMKADLLVGPRVHLTTKAESLVYLKASWILMGPKLAGLRVSKKGSHSVGLKARWMQMVTDLDFQTVHLTALESR